MATKKQTVESGLGSWTDQAHLTRAYQPNTETPSTEPASRESYEVAHSLIDRIADTAQAYGMSQNEVIGHLLTWALDQIDAGHHALPARHQR
ncbi:hypothetical protein [Candidatus Entotheonella palauensis]|uniref:Uncharacterized protein n=1 Tax=Candidatus Entotheonella gemina TaxID=1429439 RepID=W4LKF5_9BACT|nr:hypothetical protein [Candidatus Entotheonella palauensis]ETW97811.1 MAG: hypothetical protein ETSY2_43895 [Candidatus Entotheonella gemina]